MGDGSDGGEGVGAGEGGGQVEGVGACIGSQAPCSKRTCFKMGILCVCPAGSNDGQWLGRSVPRLGYSKMSRGCTVVSLPGLLASDIRFVHLWMLNS